MPSSIWNSKRSGATFWARANAVISIDQLRVVRGDAVVCARGDQALGQGRELPLDLQVALHRDLRRLLVGALAEPDRDLALQEPHDVVGGAQEHRLHDGTDRSQPGALLLEDLIEGGGGEVRALHVHAHEPAVLLGRGHDLREVLLAEGRVDLQPDL